MNAEVLVDPKSRQTEIDISRLEHDEAEHLLRSMMLIRHSEHKLAQMKKEGMIGGPVHLGVGQEAIAAGMSQHLNASDRVFGAHRSHAHLLAINPDCHKLFAEVLGKATGFSKGMGGSMHLFDQNSGFYGSVPIVSGTVPLAVGAGFASKLQDNESVAVCYLGDGAVEEGVVHESLNLASVFSLPVIFVVENNLFASHMHISQRQPANFTARFAEANNIQSEIIDGNDIVAVGEAAGRAVARARDKQGPSFIEAITFRWYGHVDWREDIDVGVNRSAEDVQAWKSLDPVRRLEQAMIAQGFWSEDRTASLRLEIEAMISEAWTKAEKDPYPEKSLLLDAVYKEHGNG